MPKSALRRTTEPYIGFHVGFASLACYANLSSPSGHRTLKD